MVEVQALIRVPPVALRAGMWTADCGVGAKSLEWCVPREGCGDNDGELKR